MDKEQVLIKEIDRGERAKRILEDPLVQEAIDVVTESFNKQMLESKSNETEFRDLCWRSIKAAGLFHQFFRGHIETGLFAGKELERIREHKDKVIGGTEAPYGALV